MIKVIKHDDIVWKKCDGCDNLATHQVILDTGKSDMCDGCFNYLKQQILSV